MVFCAFLFFCFFVFCGLFLFFILKVSVAKLFSDFAAFPETLEMFTPKHISFLAPKIG